MYKTKERLGVILLITYSNKIKVKLTSKERVMLSMRHEEPDRVPICFDCSQHDKIDDLVRYCGVNDKEALLQLFHSDCRWCVCWQDTCPENINLYSETGTFVDMWGVERDFYGGYAITHPLAYAESIEDIENYAHWPDTGAINYRSYIKQMESHQEYAVFGGLFSPFAHVAESLLGMEKFMIMMLTSPEVIHHLLDKIVEFYLQCNKILFDKARDKMHIFHSGDDYGTQLDLLYSPELWRAFIKPRIKQLYDLAKEHGYKIMHHSCGSIIKIIPELIEIGLDGLQPIQVCAAGMDTAILKQKFGSRLAFMGAIDAQNIMPFGSLQDVKDEVKRRINDLAPNGGFILSTSQGIMPEIPNENIVAMFEAAIEYGKYT